MKKHFCFLSFIMISFCCIVFAVSAEELTGKVSNIKGDVVTVRLEGKMIPVIGDSTTLILDHPDLGEMSIGLWQVTKVHYPTVEAKLVEATGEPEIGVRAVIISDNPRSAVNNAQPETAPEKNIASVADKALLRAVLDKSLPGIKRAMKDGADVNSPIQYGATVLFAAVETGALEIIKYLLENGSNPAVEDSFGLTAIMYVPVIGGKKEMDAITMFRQAGVSLNAPTSTGMTLLHAAAKGWSSTGTVSYLLNAGADVNAQLKVSAKLEQTEWQGYTPLMFAVTRLDKEKVSLLLAAGADSQLKSHEGKTALELLQDLQISGLSLRRDFTGKRQPFSDDERETARTIETMLLDTKASRQKVQNELQIELVRRIKENDLESVMKLINLGADPRGRVEGVPILVKAVRYGSKDMVMAFLNHGADPLATAGFEVKKEYSPLMAAIFSGNLEMMKLFLAKGADPNDIPWKLRGKGILHEFLQADINPLMTKMILALIDGGADPNWRDKDGNTPLHIAATHGNELVFNVLLRAGANPHTLNRKRQEPIDLAQSTFLPGFDRRLVIRELQRKIRAVYKEHNWQKTSVIARQLINKGETQGYLFLGIMAKQGKGRPVNYGEAMKYFKNGAEAGSVFCMYHLGNMYKVGNGVMKNSTRAAFWYEKAAMRGSVAAQRELGLLYLTGEGVEMQPELAFKFIKRAAVQGEGNRKAIYYLARLCEQGIGTPVNLKMAEKLYKEAKQKGYTENLHSLEQKREKTSSGKRTTVVEYPRTPLAVISAYLQAFQTGDYKKASLYVAPEEREKLLKEFDIHGDNILKEIQKRLIEISGVDVDGNYAEAFISITDGDDKSTQTQNMIKIGGKWYVTEKKIPPKANAQQKRSKNLQWHKTETGKMVTLGGEIFKSGKATLNPSAMSQILEVIDLLMSEQRGKILIVGHTDSSGSAKSNTVLSQKRAQVVGKQLILLGVDSKRLTVTGYGERFPVARNDTGEGRSKNRRVEIILLDK